MRRYTILLTPDLEEGGYVVDVPALPGCHTQADTLEDAIANAREAIAVWIRSAEKHGEEIPEEQAAPQVITIDVAG
ncbi:MAG: type II toxin-antitoxin system HicB family antitoxin [Chloroflexota bacterium]|nr:MAG: type II toxin-antitoxin system HicB family antitoxin [Chloroflexota bacterium]